MTEVKRKRGVHVSWMDDGGGKERRDESKKGGWRREI